MLAHIISTTRVFIGIAFISVPDIPMPLVYIMLLLGLFSDYADGKVARLLNNEDGIGKMIDPVCDAIFLACLMIHAHIQYNLPLWYLYLVCLRYALIAVGSSTVMLHKKITLGATFDGKASICMNFLAVSYFILNNGDLKFGEPLLIMSCAMMGYSLITYFVRLVKLATATAEKQKIPITKSFPQPD